MANFNKTTDLVEMVATKLTTEEKKCSKVKAKEVVDTVLESMKDLILDEAHDGLDIYGFTKWEVKEVEEKQARNPQTGEMITVPAHNVIKAKISASVKNAIR